MKSDPIEFITVRNNILAEPKVPIAGIVIAMSSHAALIDLGDDPELPPETSEIVHSRFRVVHADLLDEEDKDVTEIEAPTYMHLRILFARQFPHRKILSWLQL